MTESADSKLPAPPGTDLKSFFKQQQGLERGLLDEMVRSRRLAWWVALVAIALAVLAVLALLAPFKPPPELYVVRVNEAIGTIEHVSRIGDVPESYGERLDRTFVYQYVLNCESYDWYQIQEKYNTCGLYSASDVLQRYHQKVTGDRGWEKTLNRQFRRVVEVQPPVLGANNTATVRFSTRKEAVGRDLPSTPEYWIATVSFHYVNADMKAKDALLNPLGFQVLSYSVDPEIR
jgi:type IV secretion system protein VirB8